MDPNILDNVKKREGTLGGLQGFLYEMHIIFLFMIHSCLNNVIFKIKSNVNGFGNFDDLVAKCQLEDGTELLICLQSKHLKESENKIDLNRLKGSIKKDNKYKKPDQSFNLKKYREEILKSEKISNYADINVKLIFYTTVPISETDADLQWCNIDKNDILCLLLNTSASNNCARSFSDTGNEKILSEIEYDTQFLKKICIFSNQCQESDFDKITKNELRKLLGTDDEDINNKIHTQLKNVVLEWYKDAMPFDNDKFLDYVWQFFSKEMPCLSTERNFYEELSKDYKDNNMASLQTYIVDNQIVTVKTDENSTVLPAIDVYKAVSDMTSKCVRKFVFVKLQNLEQVLILFKNIIDYLIIEVDSNSVDNCDIEMLYKILVEKFWKKVVLLVPSSKKFNILVQNIKVWKYEYKFDFNSLKTDKKKYILSSNVTFQGNVMPLSELIDTKDACSVLEYETVEKLIRHETVNIGEELKKLPKEIEYCYIQRSFHCTNIVSREIFNMKSSSDVLLLSVENVDHLCKYKRHFEHYESIDKNNTNSGMFYHRSYLEQRDENFFEQFATKIEEKNVHWLRERENNLVWLETKGSVKNIQKYIQTCTFNEGMIKQQGSSEDILLECDNKLNVLLDAAGKGKSIILFKIAEQLKLKKKNCWVLHYDLNSPQMFGILYEMSKNKQFEETDAKQIVVTYFLSKYTPLEISVFNILLEKSKIYFCFDGLDEICPRYENIFIALVKKLNQSSTKQIWLTSREHMRESLQNNFPVFPIKLLGISVEDQINFSIKYYTFKFNIKETCKEKIEQFSKATIKNLSSVNATILEFMGIPLLTKMLVSINLEQCKKYLNNTHEEANLPMSFENIFDLYQTFFENALKRYLNEKECKDLKDPRLSLENKFKKYQKLHMFIATRSLLPEHYSKMITEQGVPDRLTSDQETKLLGIGIITSLEKDNAKFLHFTFAEFMLANLLLVNMNKMENTSELQTILNEVLHNLKWEVVRKFLNSSNLLAASLSNIKYNPAAMNILNLEESSLTQALEEKNRNIVRCILQCLREVNKEDVKTWICHVKNKMALYIAIKKGYMEEVSLLLDHGANIEDDIDYYGTPLMDAVRQGNLDMITLLLAHGANINQRDKYHTTAILEAAHNSTPEVLDLLLAQGASSEDKGRNETTLLMHAATNIRNDTLVHILNIVECDVNYKDSRGYTALHKAAHSRHNLNVKTLLDLGADIDSQNEDGESPLHLVVNYYRHFPSDTKHMLCAKYLIKRGARTDITNKEGKTALGTNHFNVSRQNKLREWIEKESEHESIHDLEKRMKNYSYNTDGD